MREARPGSVERVIDANANRAREGLRVAEDYARFVLADGELAGDIRAVRHRVTELVGGLAARTCSSPGGFLAERDAEGDPGADPATFEPAGRATARDVAASSIKRAQEALRSLAEFTKLLRGPRGEDGPGIAEASAAFERERYALYDLEKRALVTSRAGRKVERVRLCVELSAAGAGAVNDVPAVAVAALEGGADCVELRPHVERRARDRELLRLARDLRRVTSERGALLVCRGRADIARLAGADGVVLGREDLSVAEARRILSPGGADAVVMRSVGSIDEAREAEGEGATCLALGPVFMSSAVKQPALSSAPLECAALKDGPACRSALLECAALSAEIGIPWFASGGITPRNVDRALDAGARRVVLSAADLTSSSSSAVPSPGAIADAVRLVREKLDKLWEAKCEPQ